MPYQRLLGITIICVTAASCTKASPQGTGSALAGNVPSAMRFPTPKPPRRLVCKMPPSYNTRYNGDEWIGELRQDGKYDFYFSELSEIIYIATFKFIPDPRRSFPPKGTFKFWNYKWPEDRSDWLTYDINSQAAHNGKLNRMCSDLMDVDCREEPMLAPNLPNLADKIHFHYHILDRGRHVEAKSGINARVSAVIANEDGVSILVARSPIIKGLPLRLVPGDRAYNDKDEFIGYVTRYDPKALFQVEIQSIHDPCLAETLRSQADLGGWEANPNPKGATSEKFKQWVCRKILAGAPAQ